MGMFSWCCKGCGAELCEPEVATVVGEDFVISGEYDGYGRAGMYDFAETSGDEPAMWHKKCYDEASPAEQKNTTPSKYAPNQGFGEAQSQFRDSKYN